MTTSQTASIEECVFQERMKFAADRLRTSSLYRYRPILTTVESHTQGEPTRIVISGLPDFHEPSAVAVRNRLEREYDGLRQLLMLEPRGHRDMFGAFLFPPTRSDADLGVVFSHSSSFANMCGHGSIGVATFAVESGLVTGKYESFETIVDDDISVRLDTPAGLVDAKVHVRSGKVVNVTITNVPAFVARDRVELDLDGVGVDHVEATIAFGGSFFALVDADAIALDLSPSNSRRVSDVGMAVLRAAREQCQISHPLVDITGVDLVEFGSVLPGERRYRNGVVFGDHQIDRSPCGTGTSAKLAMLLSRGQIGVGEQAVFSSLTGSQFIGEIERTSHIGPYDAIIPKITGQAFTTGFSSFVLDPDDIYQRGFLV
ncbi:proline racemase family protein [Bifidobacterium psychraerophilum]|uniref:proline racemase family protein n=1 Tax=Bifidobacterium psychraerophilum TaxID=218140 RepID=UPI0039E9DD9D